MKTNKFIFTAAALLLATVGGVQAFAKEGDPGQMDRSTDTKVTITDDPNENPGNDGSKLSLEHVPSNFDFSTTLTNKKYSITSGTVNDKDKKNTIDVFNSKVARTWDVKTKIGVLKDNKTNVELDNPVLKVTIDGKESEIGTGHDGIVWKNLDGVLTADNNTGLLSKEVTAIKIDFMDPGNQLKVDSELHAQIDYNLSMTPRAN